MNFRLPLITLVVILFIASCSESPTAIGIDTQFPKAVFNSEDEYFTFTSKIQNMSDAELDKWEKENGFVSHRTLFNQARKKYSLIEDENERETFLNLNADILFLSDSALTPKIDTRIYQAIVNREGVYETTGFINRVIGNYIVSTDRSEYFRIKDLVEGDLVNSKIPKVDVFNFVESEKTINSSGRVNTSCTTLEHNSYFNNASNCKNDREVYLAIKSYNSCKWMGYKTDVSFRSISIDMMAFQRINGVGSPYYYTNLTASNRTSIDAIQAYAEINAGDALINQATGVLEFSRVYGEATTRGIGDNWAIVSCQ